jgi:hypothetical protein
MMSAALEGWRGASSEALDEIELMHAKVEGTSVPARQLNYAYAVLLTAHFQLYCRALHTEAGEALVVSLPDPALAAVVEGILTQARFLDKGNPTPGNLGRDFGRFGFGFWKEIQTEDRQNRRREAKLEHLLEWRNAIVHGDILGKRGSGRLVPRDLNLEACREWRGEVGGLVVSIDRVVARRCPGLGEPPNPVIR